MIKYILLILLFTSTASAQNILDVPTQLKCMKEKILFHRKIPESKVFIHNEVSKKMEEWSLPEHVHYLYISDKRVMDEKGEIVSKRTKNARFFEAGRAISGKQEWKAKLYTGEPFYHNKESNTWYLTESDMITPGEYERQTRLSWWEKLGIAYAASGDPIYSGAGDGHIYRYLDCGYVNCWDTIHDYTSGTPNHTGNNLEVIARNDMHGSYEWEHWIYRGFFPVDTSGLPDDANITSATMNLYCTYKFGSWEFRLVEATQDLTWMLKTTDYDECGAVDDPTALATDIALTAGQYNVWTLNQTGLDLIDVEGWTKFGLREWKFDGDDVEPGYNQVSRGTFSSSERAGTEQDPYLEVVYTIGGEAAARRIMLY